MARKKDNGWIKVHRSLLEHDIWNGEPFTRGQAWIDILLRANHEGRSIMLRDGTYIVVEPGQHFTSMEHLAEHWGWSRNRVIRFFRTLSAQGMCTVSGTARGTLITVINWEKYQHGRTANGTTDGATDGATDGTTGGTRTRSIKNYSNKNDIQEKAGGRPVDLDGDVYE